MITDPFFYLCAIPAVLLFAMAKGGLGGAVSLLSVPLMSLAVPPLQAAAILLPLLVAMDAMAMWSFRGQWEMREIKIIVPGAILGVVIGALTFRYLSEDAVRIMIAAIALIFSLDYYRKKYLHHFHHKTVLKPAKTSVAKGSIWSAVSGFTSFGIHAGGPPMSVYLLPLQMEKKKLMATFALFFGVVNLVKLVPYAWMNQINTSSLTTSLVLMPLAPIGVRMGYFLLHKVSEKMIYEVCYLFLVVVGIKLLWEGIL